MNKLKHPRGSKVFAKLFSKSVRFILELFIFKVTAAAITA